MPVKETVINNVLKAEYKGVLFLLLSLSMKLSTLVTTNLRPRRVRVVMIWTANNGKVHPYASSKSVGIYRIPVKLVSFSEMCKGQ